MDDRYGMQGKCLISRKEPAFMLKFDDFPPEVRERLRNSSYDLCSHCVHDICGQMMCDDRGRSGRRLYSYGIQAIDRMEHQIRRQEVPQAQ